MHELEKCRFTGKITEERLLDGYHTVPVVCRAHEKYGRSCTAGKPGCFRVHEAQFPERNLTAQQFAFKPGSIRTRNINLCLSGQDKRCNGAPICESPVDRRTGDQFLVS